jgi:hypothetical protein
MALWRKAGRRGNLSKLAIPLDLQLRRFLGLISVSGFRFQVCWPGLCCAFVTAFYFGFYFKNLIV